ncbi:MAG: 23S rRNA (adenine(2503)-C(2))-methyltransferase RlmN [Clostridia bacterium]|nr:23S rRNA (adenine(2503)-C(2))-methyltransferase RlmN [Clostridia bacterium]
MHATVSIWRDSGGRSDVKPYFYDLGHDDWVRWVQANGLPAYRAAQIFRWSGRGVREWGQMTDQPAAVRELLARDFDIDGLQVAGQMVSQVDETTKTVFRLRDGNLIETVLMRYRHGDTVCISSQAGCRMGCSFCASTGAGFGRSLTAGEMLAQAVLAGALSGVRVSRIVVMGIGEPFDNYDNLIRFLHLANEPEGLGIGMRHLTVSTCGCVPEMIKFTNEELQVNLSVSLHAPDDETRIRLMPIARKHPIDTLMAASRAYTERTGRRITFEYSLFLGVNDSPDHAKKLCRLLKGMLCHVNLIPANEFEGGRYTKSRRDTVQAFRETLESCRIPVTVRRELGTDIMAACGQLRRGLESERDNADVRRRDGQGPDPDQQ